MTSPSLAEAKWQAILFWVLLVQVPVALLWSHNWFLFTPREQLTLFCFTLVLSGMLALAATAVARLLICLLRVNATRLGTHSWIAAASHGLFGSVALVVLLDAPIQDLVKSHQIYFGLLALFFLVLTFALRALGYLAVTAVLGVMLVVPTMKWLQVVVAPEPPVPTELFDRAPPRFHTTPDIFMFMLESYPSPKALTELHGLDGNALAAPLGDSGFVVRADHMANYWTTLTSLLSLFSLHHHHYQGSAGRYDHARARRVIGGTGENFVVHTLKSNGYRLLYAHADTYAFFPSKNLDRVFPPRRTWHILSMLQSRFVDHTVAKLRGITETDDAYVHYESDQGQLTSTFTEFVNDALSDERPTFLFIKTSVPVHFTEPWNEIDSEEIRRYVSEIRQCNALVLELVSRVRVANPEAIVLIIGDHGSWKTRYAWVGGDPNASMRSRGLSPSTVTTDLFSTFFAIAPQSYGPRSTITHVNVFHDLFSRLAERPEVLDPPATNDSFAMARGLSKRKRLYLVSRNGVPLPQWVSMDGGNMQPRPPRGSSTD